MAPDRRTYVVQTMEQGAGLPAPITTPPTSAETIGVRFIATFMAKTALTPAMRWVAVNGVVEDDDGSSLAGGLFAAMPAVHADWAAHDQEEEWATSRYWFLVPNDGESNV